MVIWPGFKDTPMYVLTLAFGLSVVWWMPSPGCPSCQGKWVVDRPPCSLLPWATVPWGRWGQSTVPAAHVDRRRTRSEWDSPRGGPLCTGGTTSWGGPSCTTCGRFCAAATSWGTRGGGSHTKSSCATAPTASRFRGKPRSSRRSCPKWSK